MGRANIVGDGLVEVVKEREGGGTQKKNYNFVEDRVGNKRSSLTPG